MKITYEFDNGEVITVEAPDEIGKWILASRRREASDDRNYRRNCYSLDAAGDKTAWAASNEFNPEAIMNRMIREIEEQADREDKRRRFRNAMKHLTGKERELMHAMVYEGKTQADFAREHSADKGMISRRYHSALKKIKKFF